MNEDGTKEITQTVRDDKGTRKNKFNLGIGQERPKELLV
jgi:hypothetical protein